IDKSKLSKYISPNKLYVSPFAVKTNAFKDINKQFRFNGKLLFMGGSIHYPNVDGLHWFIKEVWQDNELEANLDILGKWSEAIIKKYSVYPNIVFQGFVSNINDFMEGCILIVPLRIGSGIRTKILEAFAAGLPVITTSIGVEGIEVKDGIHCLIANTPDEFMASIKLMVNNTKLQLKLSKNARSFVQEYYSIERCTEQRKLVLEQICEE
ncbi:MAG: glycosyltransferase family 4 protein, partial [Bacteroidota bacterium]